ncbi:MAG: FAD-dependent oxidoreductase [Nitrososphaeria archaeon]
MSNSYIEYSKSIPTHESEVVVVGGGPAGIAAAIASARNGAKTLLIERYGFVGGMATAGLVGPFMTSYSLDGSEQIIKGIFDELVTRMEQLGGAIHPSKVRAGTPYSAFLVYGHDHVTPFDAETLKIVAFDMLREAGVKMLLHTYFVDTVTENGSIKYVVFVNKAGLQAVHPKIVVDCTGDADVAFSAGVPCQKGRGSNGLMQPVSMFFRIRNVNTKKLSEYIAAHPGERPFSKLVEEAKKKGDFPIARDAVLLFHTPKEGEALVNVSRIHYIDGTNPDDLTKAEIEGRKQVMLLIDFFKKYIPGLENVELVQIAPQIGIRETRHILGEYSKEFDDVIGLNSFPIDIHSLTGVVGRFEGPKNNKYYEIPYRILLPANINNLLVGGRCVSATHEAAGSLRVMPPCFVTGQAAGTAAALSVKNNISPKKLDYKELQKTLISQKVILPKRIK